jgi:uncharacterized protein with FMN-binding domain
MKIFLIIIAVLLIITVPMLFFMFSGMGAIKSLVIHQVDLTKIQDGTYKGSFHQGRWTYDLEVTIQSHRITSVKNTNKKMEMLKAINDKLASTLIEKQQIPFDTVSGATLNTKAFLKAVENTLATSR